MGKQDSDKMNASDWDDSRFSQISSGILSQYRNQRTVAKIMVSLILLVLAAVVIWALVSGIHGFSGQVKLNKEYKKAVSLFDRSSRAYDLEGLEDAKEAFLMLDSFKDADEYVVKAETEIEKLTTYQRMVTYYDARDYKQAFLALETILDYRDSHELALNLSQELYEGAEADIGNYAFEEAKKKLNMIPAYLTEEYEEAQTLCSNIDGMKTEYEKGQKYEQAVTLYSQGEIVKAQPLFMELGTYQDAASYLDQIGSTIYNNADKAYADKDYIGSYTNLGLIDEADEWSGYTSAAALKEQVKDEYISNVEAEATNILYSKGYNEFTSYIKAATNEIFTSSDVTALENQYRPDYLSELDPFDSFEWENAHSLASSGWSNMNLEFEDDVEDIYGNVHSHAMVGGGYANGYYLDGKYGRISGTLFILSGEKATEKYPVFISIKNGNGDTLYTAKMISGDGNVNFSVDIIGEEKIYIYFDGYDGDFVNSYYYGGVGDLALFK